ncbi:MAG: hypothetical protein MUP11_06925 [Anaerolineales bacterium]|nr:hypothetical protein [Anaerolineales bacterium]
MHKYPPSNSGNSTVLPGLHRGYAPNTWLHTSALDQIFPGYEPKDVGLIN